MYTNADCTIFHKYYDAETYQDDAIAGFYIPACFWDSVSRATRISAGAESSDSALIIIPDIENFVQPKAWEVLEEKGDYWTIGEQDKIVKGNIPIDTKLSDLEDLYDDVFNVMSVDPKLFGSASMQHIEVGAK